MKKVVATKCSCVLFHESNAYLASSEGKKIIINRSNRTFKSMSEKIEKSWVSRLKRKLKNLLKNNKKM